MAELAENLDSMFYEQKRDQYIANMGIDPKNKAATAHIVFDEGRSVSPSSGLLGDEQYRMPLNMQSEVGTMKVASPKLNVAKLDEPSEMLS